MTVTCLSMHYQILGRIGATAGSCLYRARRLEDDAPVMLAMPMLAISPVFVVNICCSRHSM